MAIEFRCIRCGQRLRVGDDDRGMRARCPTCNAIVDVPENRDSDSPIVLSREKSDVIDYELFGDESQYVEITLDPGEITVARIENLLYMSPGIAMESTIEDDKGSNGGLLEKISQVSRRILTGTTLGMTAFCNVAEQREVVAFCPDRAGRLVPVHLDEYDNQLICQGAAILCAARGIEIRDTSVPGISDAVPMDRISGDGIAVLQSRGQLFHRRLNRQHIVTRTDNIVAFTQEVTITPHESVGVEHQVSVSTIAGPGEVWLQTGG